MRRQVTVSLLVDTRALVIPLGRSRSADGALGLATRADLQIPFLSNHSVRCRLPRSRRINLQSLRWCSALISEKPITGQGHRQRLRSSTDESQMLSSYDLHPRWKQSQAASGGLCPPRVKPGVIEGSVSNNR